MTQRDVTKSGQHLAKALVTPSGGGADATLADVAAAAVAIASTDKPGRVALATAEQTAAGKDATRAVTPAALAAQDFIAHAALTNNPHSVTAAQIGAYTTGEVDAALDGKVAGRQGINAIVRLTQAAYDSLSTRDDNTLYVVVG